MAKVTPARRQYLDIKSEYEDCILLFRMGDFYELFFDDAKVAAQMADDLLEEGIYVIGFSYPVVPRGEARIRVQLSAAHTREHLDRAVAAFEKVGRAHGIV